MLCRKCILDTNIYQAIATNKITRKLLKSCCDEIFLTPVNILEVISKTNISNFERQQKIARQFSLAGEILDTTNNIERKSWLLPPDVFELESCKRALFDFNTAKRFENVSELIVNAKSVRDNSYKKFQSSVHNDLKDWKSKCEKVKEKFPSGIKSKSELFKKIILEDSELKGFLLRSRELHHNDNLINETNPLTEEQLSFAGEVLNVPILFYAGYLAHSIEIQPEYNDYGDIMLTGYLGLDLSLGTNDGKILSIAKEISLEDRVFNPLDGETPQ